MKSNPRRLIGRVSRRRLRRAVPRSGRHRDRRPGTVGRRDDFDRCAVRSSAAAAVSRRVQLRPVRRAVARTSARPTASSGTRPASVTGNQSSWLDLGPALRVCAGAVGAALLRDEVALEQVRTRGVPRGPAEPPPPTRRCQARGREASAVPSGRCAPPSSSSRSSSR